VPTHHYVIKLASIPTPVLRIVEVVIEGQTIRPVEGAHLMGYQSRAPLFRLRETKLAAWALYIRNQQQMANDTLKRLEILKQKAYSAPAPAPRCRTRNAPCISSPTSRDAVRETATANGLVTREEIKILAWGTARMCTECGCSSEYPCSEKWCPHCSCWCQGRDVGWLQTSTWTCGCEYGLRDDEPGTDSCGDPDCQGAKNA